MKKSIQILIAFFLICLNTNGQTWEWAKSAICIDTIIGGDTHCIAIDGFGNEYIVGAYQGTIAFGNDTLFDTNYDGNMFLAKYDSSGQFIWARNAGSSGASAYSVATDLTGNVYVAGNLVNALSIIFGNDTLINHPEVFLVKYNSSGTVLWARGGIGACSTNSIATDATGNVYLAGNFAYGSVIFGTDTLTSYGYYDIFLVKYDSNGNVIFAKCAGGNHQDWVYGVATDLFGNVFITGYFASDSILFGSHMLHTFSAGSANVFIVKYNSIGQVVFAKCAGGMGYYISSNSVASDAAGNVYITGVYKSPTIVFDTYILNSTSLYNAFIVKYDSSGIVNWAKTSAYGDAIGWCIAIDNCENINVSGSLFYGPSLSDSIVFGNISLHSQNDNDNSFIVQLNSSGNAIWGTALPYGGDDINPIIFDADDNMYLGWDSHIPTIIIANDTLINHATETPFIAKLHFNCSVTGIHSLINYNPINIFPNPASTILNIHHSICTSPETLLITDLLGTVVYKEELTGISTTISISTWSAGIYFYEVRGEKGSERGKFVVQH